MDRYCKRLIEVDLPIARISASASAEKASRAGHIPRLHIYPAARPTGACRAVLCAALWPDPCDLPTAGQSSGTDREHTAIDQYLSAARLILCCWGREHLDLASEDSFRYLNRVSRDPGSLEAAEEIRLGLLHFIADFSDQTKSDEDFFVQSASRLTKLAHRVIAEADGDRPIVVDPFAGGGAIPLEALRVGAQAYASDLNPVAVLLEKVLLEYLPVFADDISHRLHDWLGWAKTRATDRIGRFYPGRSDGSKPVVYLWARTVLSESPEESAHPIEVPLLNTMWLAKKGGKKRALRWVRSAAEEVLTEVATRTLANGEVVTVRRPLLEVFEPKNSEDVAVGTVARLAATCPVTGYTTPTERVAAQLRARGGGTNDARLYCVVVDPPKGRRDFVLPEEAELRAAESASDELRRLEAKPDRNGLSIYPREPLPPRGTLGFRVQRYGMSLWCDLFTPRQLLALITYSDLVGEYLEDLGDCDPELRRGVAAALGLVVDRLADLNSSLCRWQLNTRNPVNTFNRWALPMASDFGEVNPLAGAGGSPESTIRRAQTVVARQARNAGRVAWVSQGSATELPLPDDSVHALFTDPPYYDAVPYADLLDFFYVWLKRSVGFYFPELFGAELTPKAEEICEMGGGASGRDEHKNAAFFETEMARALGEARRVVRPEGIGVVVFAHKSTQGWEAMLQALIEAGWTITASWPIDTELRFRLRARGSAALASSVHIVCRPRENPDGSLQADDIGNWREVLAELPKRIHAWMPRLAEEGVVGADAIFACLGPALEVYSRYSSVERASGEEVTLKEYLGEVWAAVSHEALNMIFEGADASGFEEDARLTAMWLWTLHTGSSDRQEGVPERAKSLPGYGLDYDAARKIAQGLGAHLEDLSTLVEIRGATATLLSAAARVRYLFGKDAMEAPRGRKAKKPQMTLDFAEEVRELEAEYGNWADDLSAGPGLTILDQLHQSMILFGAGRGVALRRLLVEDGVGRNPLFWRLAQALSALYPSVTEEKRWADGVLGRKKGLGL